MRNNLIVYQCLTMPEVSFEAIHDTLRNEKYDHENLIQIDIVNIAIFHFFEIFVFLVPFP